MFPSPIAGNQTFTNVVNLAGQLPLLNVSQLEAGHASAVTGDITRLTHGDDPVRTTVFGVVTTDGAAPTFYSFLDKSTGAPLVLPENTEIFSLRYVSPNADVVTGGSFDIGIGDIAGPTITTALVRAGTQAIANGTTGGYVQGTVLDNATFAGLNPVEKGSQCFGGTGDGGPSELIVNVPAAPDNQLLLRSVGAAMTGTVEISVEYVVRRDQL